MTDQLRNYTSELIAVIYADMFRAILTHFPEESPARKALVESVWKQREVFDFDSQLMLCDDVLIELGLATYGPSDYWSQERSITYRSVST